jgi:hypothetical protein
MASSRRFTRAALAQVLAVVEDPPVPAAGAVLDVVQRADLALNVQLDLLRLYLHISTTITTTVRSTHGQNSG